MSSNFGYQLALISEKSEFVLRVIDRIRQVYTIGFLAGYSTSQYAWCTVEKERSQGIANAKRQQTRSVHSVVARRFGSA